MAVVRPGSKTEREMGVDLEVIEFAPWLKRWGKIVVPYFVTIWKDDTPEFRVIDPRHFLDTVRKRLCWICGKRLGKEIAFAVGPMCTINRVSIEPPQHEPCAIFAATHCPFMTEPDRVRRPGHDGVMSSAGIRRNPGVTAIWVCKSATLSRGAGEDIVHVMGEPIRVLWYREARLATRVEVEAALESGMPILAASAREDPQAEAALKLLAFAADEARKWIPAEEGEQA